MRPAVRRLSAVAPLTAVAAMVTCADSLASPRATTARTNARLTCYKHYDYSSVHPWVRPRRCMQFVGNQPNHADEVNVTRIRWRHWDRRRAIGTGTWVYYPMGSPTTRTRVHLFAYRPFRYNPHYFTRLRLTWKGHGHTRHLTLKPPAPPGCIGSCD